MENPKVMQENYNLKKVLLLPQILDGIIHSLLFLVLMHQLIIDLKVVPKNYYQEILAVDSQIN